MKIDLSNKLALVLQLLSILILAVFLQWGGETLKYLFYLRVPIIGGLLLFLLPAICMYGLPSMLGNMFVMSNLWRLAMVIAGAVAVGLGLVLTEAVIGANASARFGLEPCSLLESLARPGSVQPYLIAILLALPTAWTAYWASGPESLEMSDRQRNTGAAIGAVLSLMFLYAVDWSRRNTQIDAANELLVSVVSLLPEPARAGYLDGTTLTNGHTVLGSYLLVATILYFIGLFLYRPKRSKTGIKRMQLPVISYVLGLLQIFSLILGMLTFLLDYYRVPVLLSLLAFSALSYFLWKVDHYYDLTNSNDKAPEPANLVKALQQRLQHQGDEKTLVVVCASGGGIQAAGWTTQVLIGLQEALGPEFTKSIGLISAVSGGSVGTLHFLDYFDQSGAPPDEQDALNAIFEASTADSLGSTGWGLIYPDLWRLLGVPFLTTQPRDRGAAINLDWKNHMQHPDASLRGWVRPIEAGILPVPVFNATIVEDGGHYLLSPMSFGINRNQGVEFNRLYPDCDVDASTAALLSATFPYVTPVSRNSRHPTDKPIFHVADGGYFDNFGIVTAVDYLDRLILPNIKSIKKVLLVEIRAFPDEEPMTSAPDKPAGWLMALFGPIFTIVGARNATQDQRNSSAVSELIEEWHGKGIEIQDFKISFPKKIEFFRLPTKTGIATIDKLTKKLESKKYDPPLSWTLTKTQRNAIKLAWKTLLDEKDSDASKLIKTWKTIVLDYRLR